MIRRRRCSAFWASAWSFQKSAAAMRDSSSVSSVGEWAASKIAPQVAGAFQQTLGTANQIIKDKGHGTSPF